MESLHVASPLDADNKPLFDAHVCACGGMWRVDGGNFVVTIPSDAVSGLLTIEGVEVL
jgi:hypothetical protein